MALRKHASNSLPLLEKIIKIISETKALDVNIIDVRKKSSLTDFLIFASAHFNRQVQGIANNIVEALRKEGIKEYSLEGFSLGNWILIDYNDVIVHIFLEDVRGYYNIESLWETSPKIKFDSKTGELQK